MRIPAAVCALAVLSLGLGPVSRGVAQPQTPASPTAAAAHQASPPPPARAAPIRSRAQLEAYLQSHTGRPTPLDCLSPGARERFLSSIKWGSKGLGGFGSDDLIGELANAQIHDLLMLFGADMAALAPRSRLPEADKRGAQPCRRSNVPIGDLERRFNRFEQFYEHLSSDASNLDNAAALARRFDALFPEARSAEALARLDAHDLRLLARATGDVIFSGAVRPEYLEVMQRSFAEHERRGVATAADVDDLRRALLQAHRFDAARRLTAEHPDAGLALLPAFRDNLPASGDTRHTVWRVSPDGETLTREAIDLGPTQVIVAAGCHFSQDAADDTSTDPVLGPVFARHAHWLVQAPGIEQVRDVRDWNRKRPRAQAKMLYDRGEWALLPRWDMPTFYIVRGGKVIDQVDGWPRDPTSNRQPLINMLRRAGLLDAAAATDRFR